MRRLSDNELEYAESWANQLVTGRVHSSVEERDRRQAVRSLIAEVRAHRRAAAVSLRYDNDMVIAADEAKTVSVDNYRRWLKDIPVCAYRERCSHLREHMDCGDGWVVGYPV